MISTERSRLSLSDVSNIAFLPAFCDLQKDSAGAYIPVRQTMQELLRIPGHSELLGLNDPVSNIAADHKQPESKQPLSVSSHSADSKRQVPADSTSTANASPAPTQENAPTSSAKVDWVHSRIEPQVAGKGKRLIANLQIEARILHHLAEANQSSRRKAWLSWSKPKQLSCPATAHGKQEAQQQQSSAVAWTCFRKASALRCRSASSKKWAKSLALGGCAALRVVDARHNRLHRADQHVCSASGARTTFLCRFCFILFVFVDNNANANRRQQRSER